MPNSYARLGANEAPLYVSWSRQNRSQLVRLPSAHGEYCRVELRGPDPAGNPYLVIGLILAAGLDGIEHSLPLPEAVNRNLFHPSAAAGLDSLPRTLREANLSAPSCPLRCRTSILSTRPSSAMTPNPPPTPRHGNGRTAS